MTTYTPASARSLAQRLAPIARSARPYSALTKPRVVSLIVFTAVIGMFLAVPGMVPLPLLLAATAGIAWVAGAAAAVNCLVEQGIDAKMQRTRGRPLPRGELTALQTVVFSGAIGGAGLWLLAQFVNALTMWLTLATFVGYAIIYTVILKPATPQNIVIGGASRAMPPGLGWGAVPRDAPLHPPPPRVHQASPAALHAADDRHDAAALRERHGGRLLPGSGAGARCGVPRLR